MRWLSLASILLLAVAAGCGKDDTAPDEGAKPSPKLDTSSPKALAESIFAIAKSGDLTLLKDVADPVDSDGDAKKIAGVAEATPEVQSSFRSAYGSGKVSGEVKLSGDTANVPILFGPDGKKPETMKMVKRGDRWHLQGL